jgi:thiamine-phosphate pyrophosphorylase
VSLLSNSRRPLLCYVTDRRSFAGAAPSEARKALLRVVEAAASVGVDWIQIREKDLSGRECASLTRAVLECAAKSSVSGGGPPQILVNDRLDVALAERAGGVHFAENSLPVRETRRLIESRSSSTNFLVGVSCHSLEAAVSAASEGADYIFFGPVFATPSKAAYGAPQGLERLAAVCRSTAIPVLAIGGITLENAAACLSAGAAGIAAIRLFQDATDIAAAVQALRAARLR